MILQIQTIKPAVGSRHAKKRVGRGNASGHGTYSTRGGKGQRARSGGRSGLKTKGLKRLVQSTPKLRGFKSFKIKPETITLAMLNKKFADGETVDILTLQEKKIISKNTKTAKIVLKGELTKKLTVNIPASKMAMEAIIKVGGSVIEEKEVGLSS
jgi:large subunit ribosomal protein L15